MVMIKRTDDKLRKKIVVQRCCLREKELINDKSHTGGVVVMLVVVRGTWGYCSGRGLRSQFRIQPNYWMHSARPSSAIRLWSTLHSDNLHIGVWTGGEEGSLGPLTFFKAIDRWPGPITFLSDWSRTRPPHFSISYCVAYIVHNRQFHSPVLILTLVDHSSLHLHLRAFVLLWCLLNRGLCDSSRPPLSTMTILPTSGKNAAVLRRRPAMSANWSSGWLTCNMGCSR